MLTFKTTVYYVNCDSWLCEYISLVLRHGAETGRSDALLLTLMDS